MASSASCNVSTQTGSKHLPAEMVELLDVAVFSFASLSGLRSTHKVRGNPVVEGVCAMFASLLDCANTKTQATFRETSSNRLGGWRPGQEPSKELLTWVSSRLKLAKAKEMLRARGNPQIPSLLYQRVERWDEQRELVETKCYPQCWRCKRRCRFCRLKRKQAAVPSLRSE